MDTDISYPESDIDELSEEHTFVSDYPEFSERNDEDSSSQNDFLSPVEESEESLLHSDSASDERSSLGWTSSQESESDVNEEQLSDSDESVFHSIEYFSSDRSHSSEPNTSRNIFRSFILYRVPPDYADHDVENSAAQMRIKSLPTITILKSHINKGIQCSICLEDFRLRQKVNSLPCKHFYHKRCITPWLKKHTTCPSCRKIVEIPPKESGIRRSARNLSRAMQLTRNSEPTRQTARNRNS